MRHEQGAQGRTARTKLGLVVTATALSLPVGSAVALASPARPAAAHAPVWSMVPSPSPQFAAGGGLMDAVCPTSGGCLAVGYYSDSFSEFSEPFVGHSNGASWALVPAPVPTVSVPRLGRGVLAGIACATSTTCFAVGYFYVNGSDYRTLIERWRGTGWAVESQLSPPGSERSSLSDISCPTSTTCIAVGTYSGAVRNQTLVERWNGAKWSSLAGANPAVPGQGLAAISCSSASSCFAVGSSSSQANGKTLIERWNGKTFSLVAGPNPAGATRSGLNGVVCPSATSCFAVGSATTGSTQKTLIERWNGTSWSIVKSVDPAGQSSLSGISCPSSTSCYAVGSSGLSIRATSLIEQWNGSKWSIVTGVGPTPGPLDAITCRSATSCVAVGGYYETVLLQLSGTAWSSIPVGAAASALSHVSCSSATSCFALGEHSDGASQDAQPLFERWNGAQWSIATPPPGIGFLTPQGLSCPTSTSCLAVYDAFVVDSGPQPLVERWNGTSWSVDTVPGPSGSTSLQLAGVSCLTSTSCVAVGTYTVVGTTKTLVERWDGTAWSIVASPTPAGATSLQLTGVSCASATSCFAVGTFFNGSLNKTLVERWNGTSWAIVASPNSTAEINSGLTDVSCPAPASCFAVGSATAGDFLSSDVLVERWDGTAWSIVAVPVPAGSGFSALSGISCASVTTCFAVGGVVGKSVVEQWNGASWSLARIPYAAFAIVSQLAGISCVAGPSCVAVGSYETGVPDAFGDGSGWTLTERYS